MINNPSSLTCKLTTPELLARKQTVHAELKTLIVEKKKTNWGIKFRFEGSDRTIDTVSSFIKTERLCCDFFDFTITLSKDSVLWLELSGPEGTKAFLLHELGL